MLGVGADDLILLCARAFAGPGDPIAIPPAPTYPLYRIAAQLAGAEVGDDEPVLTFTCRPNSPTASCRPLPDARPLVVDEAYFEYCGETAVPLLDDGDVIVLRTFSKAFALAGARIGYALASRELAAELNARQAPAPVSSLAAALAVAALAVPPDVTPVLEERERLASALRAIGLAPLPSQANFLFVPVEDGRALGDALLRQGLVVRAYDEAIRITIRDRDDDDLLVEALARVLDRPAPVAPSRRARVRHLRATAETRIAVRLGIDGASRVSRRDRCRHLRPLPRAARLPRRARPRRRGRRRPRDRRPPHGRGHRTRVRRGARPRARRPARDRALRRRGRADGRRARARRGRPRRPAVRGDLRSSPSPGWRTHFFELARAGGPDGDPRRGDRPRPAPHRRGRVQGGRPRARTALRAESSGIPSTKGVL